ACDEDCDMAVFPEMFSTGFSMNNAAIAEKTNGFLLDRLKKIGGNRGIAIIAGMAEKVENSYENRAYVINSDGEVLGHYTKNYSFSYSGEDKKYRSGDNQLIFDLNEVSSSVFICYDLRFPELFRKVSPLVSVMYIIANWPEERIEHWNTLVKARAIENQCFVVAVNRTGIDGYGLEYNGQSKVIDPLGKEISPFYKNDELIMVEIDERETAFVRERFPFLKDMRPETHEIRDSQDRT
ncbi:MAG: hypothetical protein JEY91_15165, partial [Spirochaetaceae bacterium]|nr:hypothetical protein [Spirochaetaceae bacterium]